MTPSLYLAATMVVPVDTPPRSCPLPAARGSSSMRPRLEPTEEKYSCPGKEMATARAGRRRRRRRRRESMPGLLGPGIMLPVQDVGKGQRLSGLMMMI